jgi:DNA-binding LacI/PurR family transcriptional regulator
MSTGDDGQHEDWKTSRPKMADVAHKANVSVSTVSRVLNETKWVDPQLRVRVMEAVRELNYQPNQHARWLASRKSNVVGLVMPSVADSNRAQFLHSCSTTLKEQSFDIMVGLSTGDRRAEAEIVAAQVQSHVSGIIVVETQTDSRTRSLIKRSDVPVLSVLSPEAAISNYSLTFEYGQAAFEIATRALKARPYKRAALVSGPKQQQVEHVKVEAALRALRDAGLGEAAYLETSGDVDDGHAAIMKLLREQGPELVLCLTDYLAIAALRAAHDCGFAVPQQLSVTGFGETIYSHTCYPSLSTVRLDSRELGRRAGQTIVELINGRPVTGMRSVGFTIVPGESCVLGKGV